MFLHGLFKIYLLIMRLFNVYFSTFFFFLLLSSFVLSCKDSTKDYWGDVGDETNDTEENVAVVDSLIKANGWTIQSDFGDLPSYIRIYKSPSRLEGKKVIAYIAVASIDSVSFNVLGNTSGYNTPSEFYNEEEHSVILNGGYFWSGSSLSLLCRNGSVLCPNNQIEYRSNSTVLYYPTRGAWKKTADGTYSVNWVYTNNGVTYVYSEPAENKSGDTPLEMPSASFPDGATIWDGITGIGGGPILIKDSVYVNSYEEELFDSASGVGPEANNPRSAIALTSDRKIIFFVCEGRGMTDGVAGLSLEDEANILMDLGSTQALNLDGGGSSCLLINGQETIQPSDGEQRSVVTAISLD